jgi:Epoxide hydrolase N terminus
VAIEKFSINVPESTLEDLRQRLDATRWPDEIEKAGWDYGSNLAYIRSLAESWRNRYNWRQQETALNQLPQFQVEIDGLKIHFIHVRGKGPAPLPLIITHGWPGSFVEMTEIIPLLTDPAAHGGRAEDAFDVVVPSLPGYGFSDKPRERGVNQNRIAALWAKLMEELGYKRFGAQGGDWGATVSIMLGLDHAERMIGIHLNFKSEPGAGR